MPDEQKPTPEQLLNPDALKRRITELARYSMAAQRDFEELIQILRLLQEPAINSAVVALATVKPSGDAAIIAEVCVALMQAGTKRPKLLLALRLAAEAVS